MIAYRNSNNNLVKIKNLELPLRTLIIKREYITNTIKSYFRRIKFSIMNLFHRSLDNTSSLQRPKLKLLKEFVKKKNNAKEATLMHDAAAKDQILAGSM
jgi:hypothetical protein